MLTCLMLVVTRVDSSSCILEDQSEIETQSAKIRLLKYNLDNLLLLSFVIWYYLLLEINNFYVNKVMNIWVTIIVDHCSPSTIHLTKNDSSGLKKLILRIEDYIFIFLLKEI